MIEIDLSPLERLADKRLSRELTAMSPPGCDGTMPQKMLAGYLGHLRFIVTLDRDGQCEASLSLSGGRPTQSQQDAFWRHWGIRPDYPSPVVILNGKGLHWVVRRKSRHADAGRLT